MALGWFFIALTTNYLSELVVPLMIAQLLRLVLPERVSDTELRS